MVSEYQIESAAMFLFDRIGGTRQEPRASFIDCKSLVGQALMVAGVKVERSASVILFDEVSFPSEGYLIELGPTKQISARLFFHSAQQKKRKNI